MRFVFQCPLSVPESIADFSLSVCAAECFYSNLESEAEDGNEPSAQSGAMPVLYQQTTHLKITTTKNKINTKIKYKTKKPKTNKNTHKKNQ